MQFYEKYGISLRVLHWIIAILILGMIAVGWYMSGLEEEDPIRKDLYGLHMSFGLTVLGLVILRIMTRFFAYVPELPTFIPKIFHSLASIAQFTMYLLMLTIPTVGFLMSNFGGHTVHFFNIPITNVFIKDKAIAGFFYESHWIAAYLLLTIIGLHVIGAIRHIIVDKYNTIHRIT